MQKLRIRELREAKGLSQSDLGRAMGVSHVTVCNWESGARSPMSSRLPALASVLGVTINELFAADAAS